MMTLQCVWLYLHGWVAQDYFKEMTDNDIRKRLYEEQKNQLNRTWHHSGLCQMV